MDQLPKIRLHHLQCIWQIYLLFVFKQTIPQLSWEQIQQIFGLWSPSKYFSPAFSSSDGQGTTAQLNRTRDGQGITAQLSRTPPPQVGSHIKSQHCDKKSPRLPPKRPRLQVPPDNILSPSTSEVIFFLADSKSFFMCTSIQQYILHCSIL